MTDTPETSDKNQTDEKPPAYGFFGALVRTMVRHRNAANLCMVIAVALGLYGLSIINRQFFPDFEIEVVSVTIVWPGASAEDVDINIVDPVQAVVRLVDGVKDFSATSTDGVAQFNLEFYTGWDMTKATADVESAVDQITTLPKDIERPIIRQYVNFEPVASILISGPYEERTILEQAKKIRDGLLDRGIDKVSLIGARDQEIWVETKAEQTRRYNLTPEQISLAIRQSAQDMPGGLLRGDRERQVRSKGLVKTPEEIASIEVVAAASGDRVLVSDVADVYDTFDVDQPSAYVRGQPAIQIFVQRAGSTDAIDSLNRMNEYVKEVEANLPKGLELDVYAVIADKINQRIGVIVKNGAGGFVLVMCILFLFLNLRVAIWVATGIPIAIMLALGLFDVLDQTINMLSMFAFIMMLGVIVDDAIVVGEYSSAIYAKGGLTPQQAAEQGAIRMAKPIFAAGLTTLAAFLPIMLIGGSFGQMSYPLPIVVTCVLIASLLECYFILPAHMSHALSYPQGQAKGFRKKFRDRFESFKNEKFPLIAAKSFDNRYTTVSAALGILIVIFGLIASGWVQFSFFPAPEEERLEAAIRYQPGIPQSQSRMGMLMVEEALHRTDEELRGDGPSLIQASFTLLGKAGKSHGNNLASVQVELTPSEDRDVRTAQFVKQWEKNIPVLAGVRTVYVGEAGEPPGGAPIDFTIVGEDSLAMKRAAEDIKERLKLYPGVQMVTDTLKFGRQELLIEVNERGAALGFNNQNVGMQLRNAYEGVIARRFTRDNSEVTIRVLYPRDLTAQSLDGFYLVVPGSQPPRYIALPEVVSIEEQPGFASIRRGKGGREVRVTANFHNNATSPEVVMNDIRETYFADIFKEHGVKERVSRRAEELQDFFIGFVVGTLMALGLIYVILAIVFSSYSRPLVIMSIIPFGLIGAVFGHFVQGFNISFLSLIALLGLSGILVNNSIILLTRIEELQAEGLDLRTAVINGTKDRLRPVVLTSATTVFGLVPMLFETSVQAQYVIPIAITMAWGLATASFLVLLVLPAILGVQEDGRLRRQRKRQAREAQALAGE
ncbi:MAG: efflux RND transporter permease subunit [Parvibaculales bacterium]